MGRLTVRPRPWAMVRIDDGAWEEGPLRGRALPAGRHGVDLEYAPMSCALHRSVVVRRDVEEVVDVDMRAECAASGGAASP
jgi:hypothetical protein